MDCQEFLDFCALIGDDNASNLLLHITENMFNNTNPNLQISLHRHDAVNYTLYGTITIDVFPKGDKFNFETKTFDFVIDDGNWNGTVVRQWSDEEGKVDYNPPEPPIYTFVPKTPIDMLPPERQEAMRKLYEYWTTTDWFQEKKRAYNYDRHFVPGTVTENHYKEWADKKGLKIAREN